MDELRSALVGAGRNDLAEELNNRNNELNAEAEMKMRGKSKSKVKLFYSAPES